MKHIFYLFIFLVFILLSAGSCGEAETPATDEESATSLVEANETSTAGEVIPSRGDQYEIVVLDDSLKSPRKELRASIGATQITVNYGSPAANGRDLFGGLVPFGEVWRTGANEAVVLTVSEPGLQLGADGKKLGFGKYSLFTMPSDRDNWTYIINEVHDQWGAYEYDEKRDVLRVTTQSKPAKVAAERMDFTVEDDQLILHWGDLSVPLALQSTVAG